MLEYCGYRPDFISVITEENVHNAVKNVRLAKQMSNYEEPEGTLDALNKENKIGVECKLNYAMASGEQKNPFLLSDIYKIYVDIWRMGLAPWEFNTKQMMTTLKLKIQLVL